MKWLTINDSGTVQHGFIDGDEIVVTGEGDLAGVVAGASETREICRVPLAGATILAPVLVPGKVICIAANYQSHVTEAGGAERERTVATPRLFLKPDTAVIGHGTPIALNPITSQLDWEVEIAVWIGAEARSIPESEALDHVFGYSTSNDISARTLELGPNRDGEAWTGFFDWLEGKWLDGSAPIGPYLVTADEVPDPQNLGLTLTVNGRLRQDGTSADMIHSVAKLISFSSRVMTLRPGDVILTGTPAGVGATTGDFLQPGDVMVAEVTGLGALTTPVTSPVATPITNPVTT